MTAIFEAGESRQFPRPTIFVIYVEKPGVKKSTKITKKFDDFETYDDECVVCWSQTAFVFSNF